MFRKKQIDALFSELEQGWLGKSEYEQLVRDAHLGLALSDAGQPIDGRVDPKVAALILKHRPTS